MTVGPQRASRGGICPGIKRIVIAGDPLNGSFTLDAMTYDTIPEPATGLLMLVGAGRGLLRRRR